MEPFGHVGCILISGKTPHDSGDDMNKLFLTALLMLATSSALATTFDWEKLATPHEVNGQTLKISRMTFKDRTFAFQFCQKIGMELADIKTIIEAARNPAKPLTVAIFKADIGSEVLTGVWAWTSEPVKKVNDAKVFVQLDGNPKVDIQQLGEVNRFLLQNGTTPYKGLPAVCR